MRSPKSQNIDDKPKFKERFQQCPLKIQSIFDKLRSEAIIKCQTDDWGYSNKPDLRIGFQYNMIELVPTSKHILIMLRVDEQPPEAFVNQLKNISIFDVQKSVGSRWVKFQVSEDNQIHDALQLIENVYNRRKKTTWGLKIKAKKN